MQDVVDAFAGLAAIIKAADIALCETELRPLVAPHYSSDFVEIASMSRCKIVQSHHELVKVKESFQQVRADESGDPADQPCLRRRLELSPQSLVAHKVSLVSRRTSASSRQKTTSHL